MEVVFSTEICDSSHRCHCLEICVGDATEVNSPSEVDILAISCFENCYAPTWGTMVEGLWNRGIKVADLALRKALDERARWQCWMSEALPSRLSIGRILCFEHGRNREPSNVVGNVFRMVTEFALSSGSDEFRLLRLPLLSTGNQGADKSRMLEAIIRQAYHHLRGSLPVAKVQIVLNGRSAEIHRLVFEAGLHFQQVQAEWNGIQMKAEPDYDFFMSYRHVDISFAEKILGGMSARNRDLRIFVDRAELASGEFWKPALIAGIHNSRRTICLITDSYADSGECIDEFHVAMCCGLHRPNFLLPLLNLSARGVDSLPSTFRNVNLIPATCPPKDMKEVIDSILGGDGAAVATRISPDRTGATAARAGCHAPSRGNPKEEDDEPRNTQNTRKMRG